MTRERPHQAQAPRICPCPRRFIAALIHDPGQAQMKITATQARGAFGVFVIQTEGKSLVGDGEIPVYAKQERTFQQRRRSIR